MALIPNKVFEKYKEFCDGFIEELGVDAVINYPTLKINCENCYNNTMPGMGPSNYYRTGGPYPFSQGEVCPYCEGKGYRETPSTDPIQLRAYFDRKSWSKIRIPVGIKDGSVWTIGYMADLIKVQRAAYITIPSDSLLPLTYTLIQEPIPWGIGRNKYFSAFWERSD